MGNSESSPPENTVDDFDGVETLGYRVLGVQPNSPASVAGLVSFFDFLVGANEQMLLGSGEDLQEGEEYDDIDFPALLEKFKGKPLQLLVWNIKCQQQRLVDIVPNDDWEGAGLLGVTIRLDNYAGAEDRLIRILSVEHNSPAAIAGLVSSQDYLLGTTTHSFDSTKVLAAVLESHVDKVVELYVYNTNSDKVRVVALMPTWSWGGNGLLGAEVGTGYLHRLPGSCRSTLGGSVERRVRWIGGSKNGPTSPQSSQLQQAPTLELEPQLEMEQDDEEEDGQVRHQAPSAAGHVEREESMGTVSLASQVSAPFEGTTASTEKPAPVQPESEPAPAPEVAPPSEQNNAPSTAADAITTPTTNGGAPPTETEAATKEKAPSSGGVFIAAPKSMQNLPPTELPPQAPAPAPYSIATPEQQQPPSSGGLAQQPITVTTFIPGPKPSPLAQSISAEDLFSGPPPVAQIPTQNTFVISSPIGSRDNNPFLQAPPSAATPNHTTSTADVTPANGDPAASPAFSTPHPPSTVRAGSGGVPPTPPVAAGVGAPIIYGGGGMEDMLPPPPKMSGAQ